MKLSFASFLLLLPAAASGAGCPHLNKNSQQRLEEGTYYEPIYENFQERRLNPNERVGDYGVPEGGYAAVRAEIAKILTDSQDFFPADFGNYGGLLIRLAWHCSGSFRESDGRGGCDGGRIRFDPELNWMDNGNLDKALKLLEPVKEMFGSSLSWGDLIILAGNTAIETMGGPILGFCGGRVDDADGANSLILGPSEIQEILSPCVDIGRQGQCTSPLGPTTVGLIYVNPAGPVGAVGDPVASGADIREAFSRMGFGDRESVALIGGGHAFGKAHGACLPEELPCGQGGDLEGIGPNTFTSGFEGPWTTMPTTWTNQYFDNIFQYNWTSGIGPGGELQWAPQDEGAPDIMMLTTDIAMAVDEIYQPISEEYRDDISSLEDDFKRAWYRLTTADMGPPSRCLGSEVPPAQPFQHALPPSPAEEDLPNYIPIRAEIQALIDANNNAIGQLSMLAKMCASTFRETDYRGGCNGAKIRFSPEKDWPSNAGSSEALALLEPIKTKFPAITYADLIVLAGQTAVEAAGGNSMAFCGGRVDAEDGAGSETLEPRVYQPAVVSIKDDMEVKGLSYEEGVALYAMPTTEGKLSNQYFMDLKSDNGNFTDMEKALLEEPFLVIVDGFIADNEKFLKTFMEAWTKMMTADRYDGPVMNACTAVAHPTVEGVEESSSSTSSSSTAAAGAYSVLAVFAASAISLMI